MIYLAAFILLTLAIIAVEVWPHIRHEKELHLDDSWDASASRGRVNHRHSYD